MKAVLTMAALAKGGVSEWLDMDIAEFFEWLDVARKLHNAKS